MSGTGWVARKSLMKRWEYEARSCSIGESVFDVNPSTLAVTPRPLTASYPGVAGDPARGFVYDLGHPDMALDPFDGDRRLGIKQRERR